jgi:hypothetical protein
MSEVRVSSWAELQEALFADTWNADLQRFRSSSAYRGMSDAGAPLHTSLHRLGDPQLEPHLLRNFRKYAHGSVLERDNVWHWMSLGQQHGLPTRLLDWTYSPYVALHFATCNIERYDRDGVVWALDYVRAHAELPSHLRSALDAERSNVFTLEMLADRVPSLPALDALGDGPLLLFFEPPAMEQRIVNQYAMFSVLSDPAASLDDWLRTRRGLWRRVVVPARLKWEVRDKLDQANITERVLFPCLDGRSAWLRRHYWPPRRSGGGPPHE